MIYLDSAATTFQKPLSVSYAMQRAMRTMSSPGRGGYAAARAAEETAFRCRSLAAELFGVPSPEQVVFASNATHALNIAIRSLVPEGGRVAVSGYEHNAVTRPLHALGARIKVAASPLFDRAALLRAFENSISPELDAVVCTHVSNVFGFVLPIKEIAALCRAERVPLIVDASQSAGILPFELDTLGAAAGVCCIARKLGTPCRIVMDANKTAAGQLRDRMLHVPEYAKAFLTPQEAYLHADSRTLLVVVDTNRPDQVENHNLLEACTRVAVIDHHRRAATYITNATMSFHEPYASSACELMTELLEELVEQPDILRVEAEAMLSGIMLDTKDFTVRTGERTFEAAAFLRRAGADTSEVKKLLQTDMEHTVARYKILQTASIYRADIAIAAPTEPQDRIVAAQAADELLNIAGVTASMVIYPMGDGDVFISARAIGALNVQLVMEALGGGGSRSSAAVQLHDVSVAQAVQMARKAIDDNLEN